LLASAGRWRKDDDSSTGVTLWNPQSGAKVRTIAAKGPGTTRSVAFSMDGKQIAFHTLAFTDVRKPQELLTSEISLADVASGAIAWQRTITGFAMPIAFFDFEVIALKNGQETWFFARESGSTISIISFAATVGGGRWNDFAIGKYGHMLAYAGEDKEKRGIIYILDPDREN
jgi:hypothetical protein